MVEVDEIAKVVSSLSCGRKDWEFSGVAASGIVRVKEVQDSGCNSTLLELDNVRILMAESPLGNDCEVSGEPSSEDDVVGTASKEASEVVEEKVAMAARDESSMVCDVGNDSELSPAVVDRACDKVESGSCHSVAGDEGVGESAPSEVVDEFDEMDTSSRSGVPVPGISEVKESEGS